MIQLSFAIFSDSYKMAMYMYTGSLFISLHFALVTATTPGCADVTFVTRADWGANESKAGCCDLLKVPTPKMFIKHSSRGRCNTMEECIPLVKEIQVLHMETNGWDEIGYNFLVGEDGRVYLGRGWALEAAHTHGANDLGHGICILGDFKTEIPKSTAMNAAYTLVQCGVAMGYIRPDYLASFNTTSLKTGWDTAEVLYTGSADRIATSYWLLIVLITTFQLAGNRI